jgi:hypothetical protein
MAWRGAAATKRMKRAQPRISRMDTDQKTMGSAFIRLPVGRHGGQQCHPGFLNFKSLDKNARRQTVCSGIVSESARMVIGNDLNLTADDADERSSLPSAWSASSAVIFRSIQRPTAEHAKYAERQRRRIGLSVPFSAWSASSAVPFCPLRLPTAINRGTRGIRGNGESNRGSRFLFREGSRLFAVQPNQTTT